MGPKQLGAISHSKTLFSQIRFTCQNTEERQLIRQYSLLSIISPHKKMMLMFVHIFMLFHQFFHFRLTACLNFITSQFFCFFSDLQQPNSSSTLQGTATKSLPLEQQFVRLAGSCQLHQTRVLDWTRGTGLGGGTGSVTVRH